MFIPYRVDVEHDNLPWITLAVCALCVFIYFKQSASDDLLLPAARDYCARQDHPRRFWLTLEKVTGTRERGQCAELLQILHGSGRAEAIIPMLAEQAQAWDTMSAKQSRNYTTKALTRLEEDFAKSVPPTLTSRLVFDPGKSDISRMFSAALAHGSIDHLLGNLFFFVAFAVLVETVVGPVYYILLLLELAFGTHLAYAVSQVAQHSAVPTLGLSGVVSGMIGLFAYLAPTMRIRCFAFFIVFWRTFAVPAWILAAWFVGWDVFNLLNDKGASNVNFVAHVSGAALGYLTGVACFHSERERIRALMNGLSPATYRGRAQGGARNTNGSRRPTPTSRSAARPRR